MKATQRTRRVTAWSLAYALILSTVLLFSVACTRGDDTLPGDTTAGTSKVTTPASGNHSSGNTTDRPFDPGAGTVNPNGDAGDPPTATDGGHESRRFGTNFMH